MNPDDLDDDVLAIHLRVDDEGDFQVSIGHNLEEEDYEASELEYFNDLLNGISFSINFGLEAMAAQGAIMRNLQELSSGEEDENYELDNEILFEPDEDLLKAMKDSKVVSIKRKLN